MAEAVFLRRSIGEFIWCVKIDCRMMLGYIIIERVKNRMSKNRKPKIGTLSIGTKTVLYVLFSRT